METSGLHITLGGLAAVISLVGSLGGVWRFLLKPILDGMKAEQKATDDWRREVDIRVTLLEKDASEETAKLRKELLT